MFLGILTLAIIIVAAAVHYRAGLWAAVLSLWSALLSGAVAFGFYRSLSALVFGTGESPEDMMFFWGEGLMLLGLFLVTFAVLRLLIDLLLRNRMELQHLADGIGGAVLGALAGYVMAGVLASAAQMLPVAPTDVMGYAPFDMSTGQRQNHLLTQADDVVLGLYDKVLGGALSADGDGLSGALPPPPAFAAPMPRQAEGAERILRHYFHRRIEHAIRESESITPFSGNRRNGVAVRKGASETVQVKSAHIPVEIRVTRARMLPYAAWVDTWQPAAAPGEGDGGYGVPWRDYEGKPVDISAADARELAVLLVDVRFRPEIDSPYALGLRDWELRHGFKGIGDSRRDEPEYPRPLMLVDGRASGQGSALRLSTAPAGADDAEDGRAFDPESIDPVAWHALEGGEGDEAVILSQSGVWVFGGQDRLADARLAFVVPRLSLPWHYGLRCGGMAVQSGEKDKGMVEGRDGVVGPLEFDIEGVQGSLPKLPQLKRDAASGREFLVVEVELENNTEGPLVFGSEDFVLKNASVKEQYPATLLEPLETDRDGQVLPERKGMRRADLIVYDPVRVMDQDRSEDSRDPVGYQAAERWEVFCERDSSRVTLKLVFEVPRARPLSRYDFAFLSDELRTEPPDWYLMRNRTEVRSRSHDIEYVSHKTVSSLPMLLPNGQVRDFKVAAGIDMELLVLTFDVVPKEPDVPAFYELPTAEIEVEATKGERAGRKLPIHGMRLPGDEAFRRPKPGEVLIFKGRYQIQLAYYVAKQREDLKLDVKGFRSIKLEEAAAEQNKQQPDE